MGLEQIFSEGENLESLKLNNKDMGILIGFYGKDYFDDLKGYIALNLANYLYEGKIKSITSEGFKELNDRLFDIGVGTLKRLLDYSIKKGNYRDYKDFFNKSQEEELPDPVYHVCIFDNEKLDAREYMDPEEQNIILGLDFIE